MKYIKEKRKTMETTMNLNLKECKICLNCQTEKPLMAFDPNRRICRKCKNYRGLTTYYSKQGNTDARREYMREYMRNKYQNDPSYNQYNKCLHVLRSKTDMPFLRYMGYTKDDFIQHIESQFTNEMSWDNWGSVWEIDHITSAIEMFNTGYTIREVNSLENIRPLLIAENKQRNKIW